MFISICLFYITERGSFFIQILKTEFSYLLCGYVSSILLGGTVIYSFDSYTIFYCVTIPFPPSSKKSTWVASKFCYYKQCWWDFLCICLLLNIGLCTSLSHCSTLQPMLCPAFRKAFLISLPWQEFKGIPKSPQQAIWKNNITPWQERKNVSKWR